MKLRLIALVASLAAVVCASGCSDSVLPFDRISTLTSGEIAYLSAPEGVQFIAEDGGEVIDAHLAVDLESTCVIADSGGERYGVVLPADASVSADGVVTGDAEVHAFGTSVEVRGWLAPKPVLEDQWGPAEVCDYAEYFVVGAID